MTEENEKPAGEEETTSKPVGDYVMIKTDLVHVPEDRMTSVWSDDEKIGLLESIKEKGILQPLTVISIGGEYFVVDGYNRLMCALALEIPEVPCIIRPSSEDDLYVDNLILNMMKGKNNPVETGKVLYTLINERGMTLTEAARRSFLSEVQARKYLRLYSMPEEIQMYVVSGQLGIEHAYLLSSLEKEEDQVVGARYAVQWGYNTYQLKDYIKSVKEPEREVGAGDYVFDETGSYKVVYPNCLFCGKEVSPEAQRTLILHAQCKVDLEKLLKDLDSMGADQEAIEASQPVQEVPDQVPEPVAPVSQAYVDKPAQMNPALLDALGKVLDAIGVENLQDVQDQLSKRKETKASDPNTSVGVDLQ